MNLETQLLPGLGEATRQRPAAATALRGWPLGLARGLWLAMVALTLGLFLTALPARHAELNHLCQPPACAEVQLGPGDVPALESLGLTLDVYAGLQLLLEMVPAFAYFVVAAVIFRYRSDDWLALFASLTLVVWGACLPPEIAALAHAQPQWQLLAVLVQDLASGSLVVLLLVFPDGIFRPAWTRSLAVAWGAWNLVRPLLTRATPFRLGTPESLIIMALLILAGVAQLRRLRQSPPGLLRQQTQGVVLGLGTMVLAVAGWVALHLLVPTVNAPGLAHVLANLVGLPLLLALPTFLVPLAFGAAILRYRLWDIELLVNRAFVYSLLTALLAAVYFGSVVALQALFPMVVSRASPLVVAASTLLTAMLFNPLRRRIQVIIDRSFFRHRYDAAQALAGFAANVRHDVALERVIERLEGVVIDTLQPASVAAWLRSGDRYHLAPGASESPAAVAGSDALIAVLHQASSVVELDDLSLESAGCGQLRGQGYRLAAPLVSQNELIGWLSLGPRRGDQPYSRDDRQLLGALVSQAAPVVQAAQFAQQQQTEALARERLEQELSLARLIQQRLLPANLPACPGWEAAARYQPARAVGGDFYDFVTYPDGRLGVAFGDVTGKGMPAALVMATTQATLRAAAQDCAIPGEVLRRANQWLLPHMPPGMFVACLFLVLDPATGCLQLANAGQSLPYRLTACGPEALRARGMPLGLMPDMEYEELSSVLDAGETLLLHSDGLMEAHDGDGQMFGEPRLRRLLEAGQARASESLLEGLLKAVTAFSGAAQEDDLTLVMLHRLPNAAT